MLTTIIPVVTIITLIVACFHPDLPLTFGITATGGVLMLLSLAAIIRQERSGRSASPLLPMLACLGGFWLITSLLIYCCWRVNGTINEHFSVYFGCLGAIFLGRKLCLRKIAWSSLVWLAISLTAAVSMVDAVKKSHEEFDITVLFFLFAIYLPKFTNWMQPAPRFVLRMAMATIIALPLMSMDCLLKELLGCLIPLGVLYPYREKAKGVLRLSTLKLLWLEWSANIRHNLPSPRRLFLVPMGWIFRHTIPLGTIALMAGLLSSFGNAALSGDYAVSALRPFMQRMIIFPTRWYAEMAMKDLYLWADEVQGRAQMVSASSTKEVIKQLRSPLDQFSTAAMTFKDFWVGIPFREDGSDNFHHYGGIGLWPLKKGNELYVGFVNPGSPADEAGITRGYRLLAVNGDPVGEKKYLNLKFGTPLTLDLESPEGVPVTKELETSHRSRALSELEYQFIGTGANAVGYLRFDDFLEVDLDEFKNESTSRQIDRFIIDLRYNSSNHYFANETYDKLRDHASWLLASGHLGAGLLVKFPRQKYLDHFFRYKIEFTNYNPVAREVVFLTSDYTCSAAENFIIALRPYLTTTVIGSAPTCGNPYSTEKIEYNPQFLLDPKLFTEHFFLVTGTFKNSQEEQVPITGIQPDIKIDEDFRAEPGAANDPLMQAALTHLGVTP